MILILLLAVSLGGACLAVNPKEKQMGLRYLKQFNYLSPSRSGNNDIETAIATFQDFFKLKVTGKLNNETLEAMKKPRCGNADVDEHSGRYDVHLYRKWFGSTLTYYFEPGPDMDGATQRRIIKEAFDMWARYTRFTFTPIDQVRKAQIKISFGKYKHSGTNEPQCMTDFDGWQGVLAHAYAPRDGRLHFDDSESFGATNSLLKYSLLEIAVHEIGHILGMKHSKEWPSIMYPTYYGFSHVELFRDDVDGIQKLYGVPKRDIQYVLGSNGENCDEACAKNGRRCAASKHNFPPEGALKIFESLGVSCKTYAEEEYTYPDNPCLIVSGGWEGECIGITNIPSIIDCTAGGNPTAQRLCPCKK